MRVTWVLVLVILGVVMPACKAIASWSQIDTDIPVVTIADAIPWHYALGGVWSLVAMVMAVPAVVVGVNLPERFPDRKRYFELQDR